jgi:parallel beta-helix repeat protein
MAEAEFDQAVVGVQSFLSRRGGATRVAGLSALLLMLPTSAFATTLVVNPGQSIQAAVDRAASGDVVLVQAGTYRETGRPCPTDASATCAVVVGRSGVRLVGVEKAGQKPVLVAVANQSQGIAVAEPGVDTATCIGDPTQRLTGNGVSGFIVESFARQGISLVCVDNFEVGGNVVRGNGEYGIFPSHSSHGSIVGYVATGSNDTGIYVGQSTDVTISGNVSEANVSGYEIENSTNIVVQGNSAIGNTAGILSFTLPFLDVKENRHNLIAHNLVVSNNKANTCLEPGDDVCSVPPGTGILLVAAADNIVQANAVVGNDSFGIGVTNFCNSQGLSADACASLDIQPDPDGDRVVDNVAVDNAHQPSTLVPPPLAVDLAWDGSGTGNCWAKDVANTRFPDPLPPCP